MGRVSQCLGGLTLLAGLASGTLAHAQDESGQSRDQRARTLFEKGRASYDEADYKKAAEAMEESYRLSARPQLLFNLANTYERAGAYESAAERLRLYLASARPEEVTVIRQRIARLDERANQVRRHAAAETSRLREVEQLREQLKRQNEADIATQKELAQLQAELGALRTPSTATETVQRSERSRVPEISLLLGAGALLAAGTSFALVANAANSRVDDACTDGTPTFCTVEADAALASRKRWSLAADLSFGLAAVGAGTAAYLYWARGDQDSSGKERLVSPIIAPDTLGVGLSGTF